MVSYKSKKGKVLKLSRDCYYRIVSSQDYHPEFDALDRLISYVLDRKYYAILNDTERLDELAVTGLVVGEAIAMVVTRKKVKSGNSKTGEATKKIQREKEERRATIYQDLKSIPNWQNKSKNRLAKQISKKHSGKRGFSVSAVTRLLPEC
ncbi:hypothetical protein BCV08_18935 [Vibrio breoganii]|nr:hypothetical protein BCV08_18935 [Vibrio breoganii]